jgi:DNA-binding MarR family transcriptional regulator
MSLMTKDEAIKFLSGIQQIDPDMPIQQAMCLLFIAKAKEGTSLTELSRKVGIGLTTASRYVAALGHINRHREEGYNLIESREDPMERRKKIIRLTTKGEITLRNILGE